MPPPLQIPVVPPLIWVPLGKPNLAAQDAHPVPTPNIIDDYCNESIANVFGYDAFVDRHLGVVYNNMTGNFPFISFDGSIYYLIMNIYNATPF